MEEKKYKKVQEALKACADGFFMVGAFSFFINMFALAVPIYSMQVYNKVLPSGSLETLIVLTVLVVVLLAASAGLEVVRSRILVRISHRVDTQLSDVVVRAIFATVVTAPREGAVQGMRDFDTVRQFFSGQALLVFFDLPWSPLLIGVIFLLHPLLGALALFGAVILLGAAITNEMVTKKPLESANCEAVSTIGAIGNGVRNSEVLHAMGMLGSFRRRWQIQRGTMLRYQEIGSDRAAAVIAVSKFLRMGLQTALLATGAALAVDNEITSGAMIASSIIVGRALAPFESAMATWKQIITVRSAWYRLTALLDAYRDAGPRTTLPRPKGLLDVMDLAVAPPGVRVPVLRGINFSVQPGQVLGITGPSGSGKSCLVRTIVRSWLPLAGKVRLDRSDVHQWNQDDLGPYIGYIPQDVELFGGMIAENIARFSGGSDEAIIAAAKLAGVHDMILRMPQGYDTPIGPNGRNLSAGQRQRIGLARALYGDPVLIVLDEPNSNLDQDGDRALIEALLAMRERGCAVLMVSHRPSVLQVADLLLVLHPGGMFAFGPKDEVLSQIAATAATAATAVTAVTRSVG
ncbi:type I secretion system permease/ATPase [Magnetospirillum molischianum]|uniref:Putative ABC transporter family, HlyB subfamily putative protease secretion (ATP-binding protein) n=1 Tax=Magnetospirillum molischianum DSM 120 TaxID=1150626 RepID=H8FQ99_MAGML|nr:type I secretion system permease/ATPase [Magnetospirillum molischianum]CCG40537.1 putative ABC transporter family, HlyB subfamily; putative protease secretion (ATP-binding protein) [Magnetospirillum molischianum DSM 120]